MECNMTKTCEALERLVAWVDEHVCGYCCPPDTPDDERSRIWREHNAAMAEARTALAAPARNCDVGTADEQLPRFVSAWKTAHRSVIDSRLMIMLSVFSRWAQMPYEKKEDGDEDGSK